MPAKTVAEFIAWAKQKGHVSFGSPGVGTSPHLSGVLFAKRSGLDAVHVPFRGAAQTIPAMLSGAVDFAIDNLASYISLIQSGKMRALAVTSAQRWPTLPDVPTMAEAGMKDFVVTSWAAFVLPAATPRPIVDKLSGAMKQIAADEDDAEAVSGGRRAHSFQHAGGGHRLRRQGAGDVEGRGRAVGLKASVAGARRASLC